MMRMGVGSGQGADSAAAGRGAARQALERLGPGKPDLVLVFASIHFDLPEALKGIREVTGDAPLLGCSTAGEIGTEGVQRNSIVAAAFALPDRKLVTAMVQGPNPDSRAMGAGSGPAAAGRRRQRDGHRFLRRAPGQRHRTRAGDL